jgi:chemotaxis protein CheX
VSADHPSIALPPVLDQRVLEVLSPALERALAQGGVALDSSAVERVTTPGLQVLIAAGNAAAKAAKPFTLAAPSPALTAAIATLGLEPHFARWTSA